MTAAAEFRFIKAFTKNKPLMPVKPIETALNKAKKRLADKRAENTDLKLEAEIRLCEIERCKKILEEMDR